MDANYSLNSSIPNFWNERKVKTKDWINEFDWCTNWTFEAFVEKPSCGLAGRQKVWDFPIEDYVLLGRKILTIDRSNRLSKSCENYHLQTEEVVSHQIFSFRSCDCLDSPLFVIIHFDCDWTSADRTPNSETVYWRKYIRLKLFAITELVYDSPRYEWARVGSHNPSNLMSQRLLVLLLTFW